VTKCLVPCKRVSIEVAEHEFLGNLNQFDISESNIALGRSIMQFQPWGQVSDETSMHRVCVLCSWWLKRRDFHSCKLHDVSLRSCQVHLVKRKLTSKLSEFIVQILFRKLLMGWSRPSLKNWKPSWMHYYKKKKKRKKDLSYQAQGATFGSSSIMGSGKGWNYKVIHRSSGVK